MAEADPRETFNVHEAKTHLSRLIERVEAGEEIILARAGKPCAKIVPIDPPATLPPRKPGRFRGQFRDIPDSVWFDPLPEEELALWEGRGKDDF